MNKIVENAQTVSDTLRSLGKMQRNIYFPQQRLGFVTIPKSANTSTKFALLPLVGRSKDEILGQTGSEDSVHDTRSGVFDYVSRSELLKLQPVVTFAVVRNSWSRLRSCYVDKLFVGPPPDAFALYGFSQATTFAEFVNTVCDVPDFMSEIHFRSQTALLYERDRLVPDLILRQERLSEQWPVLQAVVRASTGTEIDDLARFKSSEAVKADNAVWTADLVKKVKRRYGAEIEMFGFAAPVV